MKQTLDWVAIAWLAIWGYLSSVGASFITFQGSDYFWLISPTLLLPSIIWLAVRIYKKENPAAARITTQGVAFVAGVILLLMQFPPVVEAFTRFL